MLVQSPDSEIQNLEMFSLHFAGVSSAGRVLKTIGFHRAVELHKRREIWRV